MSVGKVKEDNDKKGEICKVIDVIMNPNVVDNVLKDANLQQFLIELLKSYIHEKHKMELIGSFQNIYFTNQHLFFFLIKIQRIHNAKAKIQRKKCGISKSEGKEESENKTNEQRRG